MLRWRHIVAALVIAAPALAQQSPISMEAEVSPRRLYVGDATGAVRRFTAGAGEVVPLAGGVPHMIRNESDADAVAFTVHAPGAPMEGFTRAAAALAADGPPSMEAVLAVAAEHGVELLGPVPAGCGAP